MGVIDIKNYVNYHVHSDYSLLDSCTKFEQYADYAKKIGQTAIASTEHGKPLGWIYKKMYCDKIGIKFLMGVEICLTESFNEKIRDNYHTIIIAKNYDGVRELIQAVSVSCRDDHFYYTNRMSFDEFFKLSSNVIKISACLASPLNKLSVSHPLYEKLVKHYDYLEIQPHNHPDQKAYNVHLASVSQKYNKPLIAGTDTHSLNSYKSECRGILLEATRKSYGDEDSFDLTYKTYDELVNAFKIQDCIPESLYMQAIENTNLMSDSVEDFEIDSSLKYPILYGTREKDNMMFEKTINSKFEEKVKSGIIPAEQVESFKDAIAEEKRVFKKIEMDGFMLSMSELISWCRENDIAVGNARGSVGGSRVAYVTDIIDLNPETWHTVFSRFANEDRKEVGDIDVDVIADDRPKIFEYIINRFGIDKTARVPSFGTLAGKSVIDEVGRAFMYRWNENHGRKFDDKSKDNPYNYDAIAKIKKEFDADPENAREMHPDIFYYYDGLIGTKIFQSVHPAGMVISPVSLEDNYGTFEKDGYKILMIDMDEIHECGLVKYDFLVLKNIQIIRDTCRMAGIEYPKSHLMNWSDDSVWNDMIRCSIGIFQFEGKFAHSLLRQFKPHNIFDMSLVAAAIRPSGASYRNDLIQRKVHKNPSALIDNILKGNMGYLVYQEDTIKFLQYVCGLSGSEADNVRRAIGRKDKDRLQKALPDILNGYCSKSDKPKDEAEKEATEFLQIIDDSADYQFGYNHSIAYCLIGYMCAWLRYHYPGEFIAAYLNCAANDEDIADGTTLSQEYRIKIVPPRFGLSKDIYVYDKKQNVISKGIKSVKYMNRAVSNELYALKDNNYKRFVDLLMDIKNKTSVDARQLNCLIKIGYFMQFGTGIQLSMINELFAFLKNGAAKEIKKDKLEIQYDLKTLIEKHSVGVNKDGSDSKSYTITDMHGLLNDIEDYIKTVYVTDYDFKTKCKYQMDILGYIDLTTGREEDKQKLFVNKIIPLKNRTTGEQFAYMILTKSVGSGKNSSVNIMDKVFKSNPIAENDIILIKNKDTDMYKNKKGYWYVTRYKKISM